MNVLIDVSLNILKNYEPNSIIEKQKANLNYLHFVFPNHKKTALRFGTIDYEEKTKHFTLRMIKGTILFPKIYLKLKSLLRNSKGIIIYHGFGMPLQFMLLKLIAKNRYLIFIQHHAEQPFQNPIKSFLQKIAYKNLDGYFFTSKENAQPFISKGIIANQSKVTAVMEGSTSFKLYDKNECKKDLELKDDLIFLWVGRLNQNKDPLTVLNAFLGYAKKNISGTLYMIFGTTELKPQIDLFLNENNLKDRVKLIGSVLHHDLEKWYNASDVFISASYAEGSGYALCEALACGCFPITTNIPSFVWMTGSIGKHFPKGDPNELLKILDNLDLKKISGMRTEIRTHFDDHLSFTSIAKTIEASINQKVK